MIVEKISGKPFGQFLHDQIFTPLKMDNTLAYEKGKNEVPHRAYGHSNEKRTWHETDQSPTSAVLAMGESIRPSMIWQSGTQLSATTLC